MTDSSSEDEDKRIHEMVKKMHEDSAEETETDGFDRCAAGHFQDDSDLEQALYNSVPTPGAAFFIHGIQAFLKNEGGNEAVAGSRFTCSPRQADNTPQDVPLLHPIRALAKVMGDAEDESVIRMYIYSITDAYVVDIMVHCAKSKDIRIIIHPEMYSLSKIQKVLFQFLEGT